MPKPTAIRYCMKCGEAKPHIKGKGKELYCQTCGTKK